MKKTSINILCILIILLITGSVLTPTFYLGKIFFAGVKDGYEHKTALANDAMTEKDSYDPAETNMVDIYFQPDFSTLIHTSDSISFKNGEKYPVIQSRGVLLVPQEKWYGSYLWVVNILYIACLVLYVLLLIQFIRFIININKGRIFERKNVSFLRHFAWYLISISLIKCTAGIIEDKLLSKLSLQLEGYDISVYWEMPWDTMLLGLLALLMAQVWSYGLQLKEDQALTI